MSDNLKRIVARLKPLQELLGDASIHEIHVGRDGRIRARASVSSPWRRRTIHSKEIQPLCDAVDEAAALAARCAPNNASEQTAPGVNVVDEGQMRWMHLSAPLASAGTALFITRVRKPRPALDDLVGLGLATDRALDVLKDMLGQGQGVAIVGPDGSATADLMSALLTILDPERHTLLLEGPEDLNAQERAASITCLRRGLLPDNGPQKTLFDALAASADLLVVDSMREDKDWAWMLSPQRTPPQSRLCSFTASNPQEALDTMVHRALGTVADDSTVNLRAALGVNALVCLAQDKGKPLFAGIFEIPDKALSMDARLAELRSLTDDAPAQPRLAKVSESPVSSRPPITARRSTPELPTSKPAPESPATAPRPPSPSKDDKALAKPLAAASAPEIKAPTEPPKKEAETSAPPLTSSAVKDPGTTSAQRPLSRTSTPTKDAAKEAANAARVLTTPPPARPSTTNAPLVTAPPVSRSAVVTPPPPKIIKSPDPPKSDTPAKATPSSEPAPKLARANAPAGDRPKPASLSTSELSAVKVDSPSSSSSGLDARPTTARTSAPETPPPPGPDASARLSRRLSRPPQASSPAPRRVETPPSNPSPNAGVEQLGTSGRLAPIPRRRDPARPASSELRPPPGRNQKTEMISERSIKAVPENPRKAEPMPFDEKTTIPTSFAPPPEVLAASKAAAKARVGTPGPTTPLKVPPSSMRPGVESPPGGQPAVSPPSTPSPPTGTPNPRRVLSGTISRLPRRLSSAGSMPAVKLPDEPEDRRSTVNRRLSRYSAINRSATFKPSEEEPIPGGLRAKTTKPAPQSGGDDEIETIQRDTKALDPISPKVAEGLDLVTSVGEPPAPPSDPMFDELDDMDETSELNIAGLKRAIERRKQGRDD